MPLHRQENVFFNIIDSENSLSEVLCNLLQFPNFKTVFVHLIRELFNSYHIDFDYRDVDTQKVSVNRRKYRGTPDVVVETETFVLLIENKSENATLTQEQKGCYRNYFKGKDTNLKKFLIFLIPKDYPHKKNLEKCMEKCIKRGRREIFVKLMTWEKLVESLSESKFTNEDVILKHFYDALVNKFKPIKFTAEEIDMMKNNEIPQKLLDMKSLVDKVSDEIKSSSIYKIGGRSNSYGSYGRYVQKTKGKDILWFGIFYEYWAKTGLPLSIEITDEMYKKAPSKAKKQLKRFKMESWDKDLWVGSLRQECLKDDNNVHKIAEDIIKAAEAILKPEN